MLPLGFMYFMDPQSVDTLTPDKYFLHNAKFYIRIWKFIVPL